jgi:hypothetical protein
MPKILKYFYFYPKIRSENIQQGIQTPLFDLYDGERVGVTSFQISSNVVFSTSRKYITQGSQLFYLNDGSLHTYFLMSCERESLVEPTGKVIFPKNLPAYDQNGKKIIINIEQSETDPSKRFVTITYP